MITEVILTQLGETMDEGTIAAWHKQVGDRVEKGEALCAVETDKAVLDVVAPTSGYLAKIVAEPGATIPVLQVIGYLADQPGEVAGAPAPAVPSDGGGAEAPTPAQPAEAVQSSEAPEPGPPLRVTPAAKRVAREHGIDVAKLKGTGPGGRVVEKDVWAQIHLQQEAAKAPAVAAPADGGRGEEPAIARPTPAAPVVAAPAAGEWDLVPLTRMRRIIAERLSQTYREAVHVTLHCEADVAEAGKLRTQLSQEWEAKHGVKVTFTDLIVKAVAKALTEHRSVNASFAEDGIRLHRRANVGVAVAVPNGLVVPVIRDADGLPLLEISKAVRRLTERARAGQITPDELHGGTFTVTNMGMMGVDTFTPIINGGEGAILGVGRIADRPAVCEGALTIRPLMPLSLSFDHRVVDGAGAAAFLARVKQILESPYLILV